jgi:Mce-associated membrane protein
VSDAARTSWRAVNVVLIVLAVALVAAIVFFAIEASRTDPAQAKAEAQSRQYAAVSRSAKAETLAFLTVDYKAMDPLIEKVLAGATGSFKEQYDGARASLKSSATTAQAVSTGKVRSVGVSELTGTTAVVFVAADSSVMNKSTKGKAQPRYYRLKLTMVKESGKWLTSGLEFVG